MSIKLIFSRAKVIFLVIFFAHLFNSYALSAENHLRVQPQIASNKGIRRFTEKLSKIAVKFGLASDVSDISKAVDLLSEKLEEESVIVKPQEGYNLKRNITYSYFYELAWKAARILRKYEDFKLKIIFDAPNSNFVIKLNPIQKRRKQSLKEVQVPQILIGRFAYHRFAYGFAYNSNNYAENLIEGGLKPGDENFKTGMELALKFHAKGLALYEGYYTDIYFILRYVFPELVRRSKENGDPIDLYIKALMTLYSKTRGIPYQIDHVDILNEFRKKSVYSVDELPDTSDKYSELGVRLTEDDYKNTAGKIIAVLEEIVSIQKEQKDFKIGVKISGIQIYERSYEREVDMTTSYFVTVYNIASQDIRISIEHIEGQALELPPHSEQTSL